MVKNSGGGNKSKGFARKSFAKHNTMLRVAKEDGEIYAQAVKVLGGSIASAMDLNGNTLRVHIRGKFRGRGKRDNFISDGTWLLVGLHDWQKKSGSDMRDCDLLEVYSDVDKHRLKNTVLTVDWSRFLTNDARVILEKICENQDDNDDGFTFADKDTEEYEELIRSNKESNDDTMMINYEEINVDDI